MREIVLDPSFVQQVQELNAKRNIPSIVLALARALDELPVDMAEDVLYHSLVTCSLGGKQLNQNELELSLLELFRIRAEKDDGFMALPTAKWNYLEGKPEYQAMANHVKGPLDMGIILHTISGFLKTHHTEKIRAIDEMVKWMEMFKGKVEEPVKAKRGINEEVLDAIYTMFHCLLIDICSFYVWSEEYIDCMAEGCGRVSGVGEFEVAFANLFIMMANEPLVYL